MKNKIVKTIENKDNLISCEKYEDEEKVILDSKF